MACPASRGNTPQPFSVTVLGVLPGAIGAGLDLIVFEAASPAIEAAGGIWAGMSGSPVYAQDGRLLGAVSYGFTATPSPIGGTTPAATMMELLSGTRAARLARLNAELERTGSPMRACAGSVAPGTQAPAGALFPGSNFVAAGRVARQAVALDEIVSGRFDFTVTTGWPLSRRDHRKPGTLGPIVGGAGARV